VLLLLLLLVVVQRVGQVDVGDGGGKAADADLHRVAVAHVMVVRVVVVGVRSVGSVGMRTATACWRTLWTTERGRRRRSIGGGRGRQRGYMRGGRRRRTRRWGERGVGRREAQLVEGSGQLSGVREWRWDGCVSR
jgi:hypothetical protein